MRTSSAVAVPAASAAPFLPSGAGAGSRPQVGGKFFFRDDEKICLRGVTYGPFPKAGHGDRFPEWRRVVADFRAIRKLQANCIRTFTPPPRWLLDVAAENGLGVLAGMDWTSHTCFLESKAAVAAARRLVRDAAERLSGHSSLFACMIGNEIPPDVVRWFGRERIAAFLAELAQDVRNRDPGALVSYANFPTTEYLALDFVDFVCFNDYLHHEEPFRRYLARLQNLAAEKPLVLSELGIDQLREGEDRQAAILAWQIRAAFESGVAGSFVFSWTDEWETGGSPILDWAFGLVDRERRPKPAFHAVRASYSTPVPPPLARPPKVSVVICSYDAERTIDACLDSLLDLDYRPLEVIVVDDGSTDRTLEIARRYPFRVIHQENRGLSAARNAGIEAATGDIVAFTDSDCVVDPQWLSYLVGAMERNGWAAAGGPNLPPAEAETVASCVAAAPGGPTHVLVDDEIAEHVPGCNMAFRRDALLEVGGFDPRYTAAGDDVDLCWRLQDEGCAIGFSPAAMVWHFRRNTVRAYLRQQRGYGKAEAMLYEKHPHRFNSFGQSRWTGRIYGGTCPARLLPGRTRIHYGRFGQGLFQMIYEPSYSMFAWLPFTLEWNLFAALCLVIALAAGVPPLVAAMPFLVAIASAVSISARAKLDPRHEGTRSRCLLALLVYLGPLSRSWERQVGRLRGLAAWGRVPSHAGPKLARSRGRSGLAWWNEDGIGKEDLLSAAIRRLVDRRHLVEVDGGWNRWDFEVRTLWANARVAVAEERHEGRGRLLRARSS
ncbi:MAG: glycosyltransferase, partial [Candidatus Binatia bacterium]